MTLRYFTQGADTYAGKGPKRCPLCEYSIGNGFQLVCTPGVCMYHEKPIHYGTRGKRRSR